MRPESSTPGEAVTLTDEIAAVSAAVVEAHQYGPSALRGVSRCSCGLQLRGMPHDHRAHLADALADALADTLTPLLTARTAALTTEREQAAAEAALRGLADDMDRTYNRGHDRSLHPFSDLVRERADAYANPQGSSTTAEAERDALRADLARAANVAHKGPNDTDAEIMRITARDLRGGYDLGGSNRRAAVARVLDVVAAALDQGEGAGS